LKCRHFIPYNNDNDDDYYNYGDKNYDDNHDDNYNEDDNDDDDDNDE
jgi:hypothetical protein